MKIKIIGANSSNRMKLLKNLNKTISNLDGTFEIELLDDEKDLKQFGVTNAPGLVINEKLVSQGKVITEREIKNYIKILA